MSKDHQEKPSDYPFKKVSRDYKNEDTIIDVNGIKIGGNNFLLIAGPCSVESEEQLMKIAAFCKENKATILRGGAFKPRTSPYEFQGLKDEGLELLMKAKNTYNIPIICEITNIADVSYFEKHIDIIQVGARNMYNYELLKALGKTKKPILLKRGLSATIYEWLLAAEYILNEGNENVILCERGIRTFENYTRNTLDIQAVIAVKQLSHLPVIVDPSHSSGRFEMVLPLSKAAMVVDAHGVMVEVHYDPKNALSDGKQSLNFENFKSFAKQMYKLKEDLNKE